MNTKKTAKCTTSKKKTNRKSKTALKSGSYIELPELDGHKPEAVKDKRVLEHIRVMLQNLDTYNCLNAFLVERDVMLPYRTWMNHCKRHRYVDAAHRILKQSIAMKRVQAAMKKECDPKLISDFQLSLYSDHAKEHYKWIAELKDKLIRELKELMEDNNRAQQPIYIQIDGKEYTISEGQNE